MLAIVALCLQCGEALRQDTQIHTLSHILLIVYYRNPSQRSPKSSSIQQLKRIVHRLVWTTKGDREGLFHVMLQSAHIWPIKS